MALHVFSKLHSDRLAASTVSYNSTISVCEKDGSWQVALELLASMPSAAVPRLLSSSTLLPVFFLGSLVKAEWKEKGYPDYCYYGFYF